MLKTSEINTTASATSPFRELLTNSSDTSGTPVSQQTSETPKALNLCITSLHGWPLVEALFESALLPGAWQSAMLARQHCVATSRRVQMHGANNLMGSLLRKDWKLPGQSLKINDMESLN